MRLHISVAALALLCLTGTLFYGTGEAALPAAFSQLEGRVAFPVFENGTYNIYVSNIDGSDRELLVPEASQPDFNTEGSMIAFRSWRHDQRGLFMSPVANIVPWMIQDRAPFESGRPDWASHNENIVFHSFQQPDRRPRIYYPTSDGFQPIRDGFEGSVRIDLFGVDPAWMPDGSIVYARRECASCGLAITDTAGNEKIRLTDNALDEAPQPSPDGSRIAFQSLRDGNWEIYVINSDGSGLRRLTSDPSNDPVRDGLPVWGSDGRTILYVSERGGDWGVWAVDADSKNSAKLFSLGGTIDGIPDPATGLGWTKERISWMSSESAPQAQPEMVAEPGPHGGLPY